MTQREKTLSIAVAAAGLLWFGGEGFTRYRNALDRNTAQQLEAESALTDANTAVARGLRAQRQLRKWLSQSLPTDEQLAESLYQDWLRSQLAGAGLEIVQVSDKSGHRRNPQYAELAVDVKAKGTLAQLADFLYRVYTAPHLHRISSATLTPLENGQKLDIALTIDALALPDCKRKDKLSESEPKKLPATMEEIRDRVTKRNLFAAYKPQPKSTGDAPDPEAAGSFLSGIYPDGEGRQMSVRTKDSGKMAYFHVGDSIQYGRVQGKVAKIEPRHAVLETEKGSLEIRIGQSFADATPEAADDSKEGTEATEAAGQPAPSSPPPA